MRFNSQMIDISVQFMFFPGFRGERGIFLLKSSNCVCKRKVPGKECKHEIIITV